MIEDDEYEYEVDEDMQDEFCVDELYKNEELITTSLLKDTQEQLYATSDVNSNDDEEEDDVDNRFHRPPTYGYSAHVEHVNIKETRNWQSSFKYLCAVGKAAQIHNTIDNNGNCADSSNNNSSTTTNQDELEPEDDIYIAAEGYYLPTYNNEESNNETI